MIINKTLMAAAAGIVSVAAAQSVSALDITINDNVSGNSWGSDFRTGINEDEETEPGTQQGQRWDLEAFHLNGTSLSMIGGFNFMLGADSFASGDIFIDINGDAVWGTPNSVGGTALKPNSLFKYDYVISFGGRTLDGNLDSDDQTLDGSYKVYSLTGASDVTVKYDATKASNPWIYNSGGTEIASGTVTQSDYLGGEYAGGTHYELGGINLAFLGSNMGNALLKFTMECGNDNLIGRIPQTHDTPSVPEGGMTLALLGMGLVGLAGIRRKLEA